MAGFQLSRLHRVRVARGYGLHRLFLAFLLFAVLMNAASVRAGSIAEGYFSEGDYQYGSLVSLSSASPPTVTLANISNSDYLVGVVEDPEDSLLVLNKQNADTNVAVEGEVYAFVSDLNGDIMAGDFIGASWVSGVGMRASYDSEQKLLGIALEDFNGEDNVVREVESVETPSGEKTAQIGTIALRLFDREVGPSDDRGVSAIEQFAYRLAGSEVPLARVILAVGLFTITVIIAGVFLANAIRGSFISIGRNPLASESIFSSLMQVSGASIGLLMIGGLISYIVLIL